MIKVSVIIPVYNGEKTIEKCLNSVVLQTLSEIEIIVVNDGSTDNTEKILKKYESKIILINQKQNGQGYARNAGIDIAKGEYVGFVDADDAINAEMYEKMYQTAKEHNSQIVQCGINDIRENGTKRVRSGINRYVEIDNSASYIYNYFYKLLHTNEVCNKIIKKSFLNENNLRFGDTKRFYSEDFKLNMEMLPYLKRISFVESGYYNYYLKDTGHCLSDKAGRIEKIINLFENVLSKYIDEECKRALMCVAAQTTLEYCAAAPEDTDIEPFLRDKRVKKYIMASMTYKSNVKHFMLLFSMLMLPFKFKKLLLNKFYTVK